MKRVNIKYGMGRFYGPYDPAATIAPPVFKTALDAWHHFVRHPEEYLMYKGLPDDLDPQRAFGQSTDDVYDAMLAAQDRVLSFTKPVANAPKEGASAPVPAEADGNGDSNAAAGDDTEEPATQGEEPAA